MELGRGREGAWNAYTHTNQPTYPHTYPHTPHPNFAHACMHDTYTRMYTHTIQPHAPPCAPPTHLGHVIDHRVAQDVVGTRPGEEEGLPPPVVVLGQEGDGRGGGKGGGERGGEGVVQEANNVSNTTVQV